MRLIHVETMCLEEHYQPLPDYVILSHTWLAQGELSLQAFRSPRARKKLPGYAKVRYCCEQAKRDGFKYVWVDSCCIDKTSSAELSESINSMYYWYKCAKICYAYLADVREYDLTVFKKSRWFTRGWTLQELIAPENVQFYGTNWTYIGSKSALASAISECTTISEDVLRMPSAIHCLSVATRMSWASQRQTTRIEDVAYCLLGIFGVNMPLLYGEGKRAFRRLQLEIIEKSDDESIFVWKSNKLPNHGSVLAEGPEDFFNSRNVVPIRLRKQTPSYSMTNKGLYISLPLLHPDQLDGSCNNYMGMSLVYWGILNCRFEGKFPQYIAIPLVKTGVMGVFLRDGIHSPIEVKEEAAAEAKLKAIYVRTDGMEYPFQARKFVLQLNTPQSLSDSGFRILRLPPSDFLCSWDPESQISQAYTHADLISTSLDFIFLSPKESLYDIWLSIRWKGLDPDSKPFVKLVPQRHLESREAWIRRIAGYNSKPQITLGHANQADEPDFELLDGGLCLLHREHGMRKTYEFRAALCETEILKEPVWAVNITFKYEEELVLLQPDHFEIST